MIDINLDHHSDFLTKLVKKYVFAEVVIIDDINRFIEENGGKPNQTIPTAQAFWNRSPYPNLIVLQRILKDHEIRSVLTAMFIKGFHDVYEILKEPKDYIAHIVLHEIAHIKHDWKQENESKCDEWAFEQLDLIKNGQINL